MKENSSITAFVYLIIIVFSSTTMAYLFALAYENGFYGELGLSLSSLPLSISDIMLSNIRWIFRIVPFFVSTFFGLIFLMKREEKLNATNANAANENAANENAKAYFPAISNYIGNTMCIASIVAFIILCNFYIIGKGSLLYYVCATFPLALLSGIILFGPKGFSQKHKSYIIVVFNLTAILISLNYYGISEARQLYRIPHPYSTIRLNKGHTIKRYIIRFLDKGVLVHNINKTAIEFISHSNILSITQNSTSNTNYDNSTQ